MPYCLWCSTSDRSLTLAINSQEFENCCQCSQTFACFNKFDWTAEQALHAPSQLFKRFRGKIESSSRLFWKTLIALGDYLPYWFVTHICVFRLTSCRRRPTSMRRTSALCSMSWTAATTGCRGRCLRRSEWRPGCRAWSRTPRCSGRRNAWVPLSSPELCLSVSETRGLLMVFCHWLVSCITAGLLQYRHSNQLHSTVTFYAVKIRKIFDQNKWSWADVT